MGVSKRQVIIVEGHSRYHTCSAKKRKQYTVAVVVSPKCFFTLGRCGSGITFEEWEELEKWLPFKPWPKGGRGCPKHFKPWKPTVRRA